MILERKKDTIELLQDKWKNKRFRKFIKKNLNMNLKEHY